MARLRSRVFDPAVKGVYHLYNRCVRGLFMLGETEQEGEVVKFRRGWVTELMQQMVAIVLIDIAFFATMDNHVHVIGRNRPGVGGHLTDREVARRWLILMRMRRNGTWLVKPPTEEQINRELSKKPQHGTRKPGAGAKRKRHHNRASELRERLADVSWFMGAFQECISRKINRDDENYGTCWSGPFKLDELADDAAILTCGVYIDLNWIAAQMAETPEESTDTSIGHRIAMLRQDGEAEDSAGELVVEIDGWLCPLELHEDRDVNDERHFTSQTGKRASDMGILPMTLMHYIKLLDWLGRLMRTGKRGRIPKGLPPILERLGFDTDGFVASVRGMAELLGKKLGGSTTAAEPSVSASGQ